MSLLGRHHWGRTSGQTVNRDPWTCSRCGAVYVVQILARDCEKSHERPEGEA